MWKILKQEECLEPDKGYQDIIIETLMNAELSWLNLNYEKSDVKPPGQTNKVLQ